MRASAEAGAADELSHGGTNSRRERTPAIRHMRAKRHPRAAADLAFRRGGCHIAGHLAESLHWNDEMTAPTRDGNGTELKDGDSVTLIKDLKVKGTSTTLKRGTLVKNIRLTDDTGEIECNAEKVKGLVLKTEFLKKA
jgi:protein PhnA